MTCAITITETGALVPMGGGRIGFAVFYHNVRDDLHVSPVFNTSSCQVRHYGRRRISELLRQRIKKSAFQTSQPSLNGQANGYA